MPLSYIQRFKPIPPVIVGVPLLFIETVGPGTIGQIHINGEVALHPITRNALLISGSSTSNTSSLSIAGDFNPWNWSWSLLGVNHPVSLIDTYASCEFANSTDLFTAGGTSNNITYTFDGTSYTNRGADPAGFTGGGNVAVPFVDGGTNYIFNVESDKQVWLYNTDSHTWAGSALTSVPTAFGAVANAQITALNGKQGPIILSSSGSGNTGNEVFVYTAGSGWFTATSPPTNFAFSAFITTDDNKVLLVGGYTTHSGPTAADALRKSYTYDIDLDTWTEIDLSIAASNTIGVFKGTRLDDGRVFLYQRQSGRCYVQIIGTNAIFDGFETYGTGSFPGTGYTIINPTSTLTIVDTFGVGGNRIQSNILNSSVSGAGENFIINDINAPSDFTIYGHVEYDTVAGTSIGLVGRYVDANNHIKILLEPGIGSDGTLRVQEVIGGVITNHDTVVNPSFPISGVGNNRDYIILARFLNNEVRVRVMRQITTGAGAQVFTTAIVAVSHLSAGKTGFFHNGTSGTNGRFDDFYVKW